MRQLVRACGVSLAIAWVGALGATACGYDPNAVTELSLPDYELFKNEVHPYLNRQCGTLDCHGQPGRPLRIYGQMGLRLFDPQARLIPGRDIATTEEEFRASFESVIGLEPEATRRVVAGNQTPETLLLLRKPSGELPTANADSGEGERHKGGLVTASNGPGYRCVLQWLLTPAGASMSSEGLNDCRSARALP